MELKSGGTDPIMTQPEAGKVRSPQKAAVKPPDRVKAPLQVPQESATFPPKPASPAPHANPRLRPPAERPAKPEASQPQKQVDPKMSQQELEVRLLLSFAMMSCYQHPTIVDVRCLPLI